MMVILMISNIQGELTLTNYNGEITALNVSGTVVATTYNGGIKVTFDKVTDRRQCLTQPTMEIST